MSEHRHQSSIWSNLIFFPAGASFTGVDVDGCREVSEGLSIWARASSKEWWSDICWVTCLTLSWRVSMVSWLFIDSCLTYSSRALMWLLMTAISELRCFRICWASAMIAALSLSLSLGHRCLPLLILTRSSAKWVNLICIEHAVAMAFMIVLETGTGWKKGGVI